MSSAFYIFRLVWPFLKELVLGGVTLKEGMRTQRKRVFLLFFVSGLIFALFLIIPKFYQLSQEHIKLEKSVEAANVHRMEEQIKELEDKLAARPTLNPVTCVNPAETQGTIPAPPEHNVVTAFKTKSEQHRKAHTEGEGNSDQVASQTVAAKRKKSYQDFFDKYDD
uniref:Uncharacterized protein n=1 Tax=Burkholderia phage vB_BgluM-SURPRISE13 TaxID=3159457 RepID=A0AAU7PFG4_9VIRU